LPVSFVVKNGSKMRERISGGIPCPVSATCMTSKPGLLLRRHAHILRGERDVLRREHKAAARRHRVARIDAEVHQHLVKLRGIADDRPELGRRVLADADGAGNVSLMIDAISLSRWRG